MGMAIDGEYVPSTAGWVRDQVEEYEGSGGTTGTTLRDTGLPVVIVTNRGAKTGAVRKTPLMRVEHEGSYAAVGSKGGAPQNPVWVYNLRENPQVVVQDGAADLGDDRPRGDRRGACRLVGAGRRRLPAVRGVPEEDRPADPGLRPGAGRGLTIPARTRAGAAGIAGGTWLRFRPGGRVLRPALAGGRARCAASPR